LSGDDTSSPFPQDLPDSCSLVDLPGCSSNNQGDSLRACSENNKAAVRGRKFLVERITGDQQMPWRHVRASKTSPKPGQQVKLLERRNLR